MCLCVWCISVIVCAWRSKNNFQELVLFLNHIGPRTQTQVVSHVSGLGFALLHKYSISHTYSSPQITKQKPLPWWFLNADATEEAQARSGLGSFPAVSLRAWPFPEQPGMLTSPNGPCETPTLAFHLGTPSQIFPRNPGAASYLASSGRREGVSWKPPSGISWCWPD